MAEFNFGKITFKTKTESPIKNETITAISLGDVSKFKLKIEFDGEVMPKEYVISWNEPQIDTTAFWSPSHHFEAYIRPDWAMNTATSKLTMGMPVCALVNKTGINRLTISHSDPKIPTALRAGAVEEDASICYEIRLFTELTAKISSYEIEFMLDYRQLPYYKTVKDASLWWDSLGYKHAYTPDDAKKPLYSAWYSFHQATIPDRILKECEVAKKLGMDVLIVDDGWQTADGKRGYGYCGDWEVCEEKIPSMKRFVDDVHALGMKFMLWFSVPFVGFYSKNFERFKGMYLKKNARMNAMVLDPRFAEVREFLVGIYERFVREYGIDGLKLDFIDSFMLSEESSEEYDKMTTTSVEEGVDLLLAEISKRLKAINPDFLIEFRQSYVGPSISKYGNMFRVTDCPNDPLVNRTHSLNMRLVMLNSAVHSDMLMWNKDETNEALSYQLLAIMFTVPQISVLFDNITSDHKKILKNFLDFWREHKETILEGEIEIEGMEANYTRARVKGNSEAVEVLYHETVIRPEPKIKNYTFNSTGKDTAYIDSSAPMLYEAYNMFGEKIDSGTLKIGVNKVDLPNGGMILIY